MENSVGSCRKGVPANSNGDQVDHDLRQESGWTQYFEDFPAYSRNTSRKQEEDDEEEGEEENSNCSNFISASLVSDAGSGPEWRDKHSFAPTKLKLINKRINREKNVAFDDSLEDTASSPVNSPKIALSLKRMDINSRKADDNLDITNYLGKGAGCHEDRKKNEQGNEMEVDEFSELKKGLCLVPVSMLMNYIA
ncbi:hypothetical protein Ancab_010923 [Ancistrocladus abbreviatus]